MKTVYATDDLVIELYPDVVYLDEVLDALTRVAAETAERAAAGERG